MSNETQQSTAAESFHPSKGFFRFLMAGNFGLAKTYWLFGVLVAAVYYFLMEYIGYGLLFWIISIPYLFYWVAVSVGIWNAAGKYRGNPIWALLARIAVIFGFWSFARELYYLFI